MFLHPLGDGRVVWRTRKVVTERIFMAVVSALMFVVVDCFHDVVERLEKI